MSFRIIAGRHRSRPIMVPESADIRPTTDRVREALFSMLTHRLGSWDEAVVLDACCGSGVFGLEALSRGAGKAYFLDISAEALRLARGNAEGLKEQALCTFLSGSVTAPPRAPQACDVILMDAPYNKELSSAGLAALTQAGWAAPAALAAVEVARAEAFTPPAGWSVQVEREMGPARLIILSYN